jgi:MoaA/NifB/PqqE/SkfB family radical SAM enzyme
MHPFTGLATREDGAIKICCRSRPVGWIQDHSLEEVWNSDKMKSVREQVLNNQRPDVCIACFDLEDQGVESLRQRHIRGVIPEARSNLYPDVMEKLQDDYSMPFDIPTMEIKLNNLCNLKCRMCNPLDSTSWTDWNEVEEFYEKEDNFLVPLIRQQVDRPGQYIGPFDNSDNWWNSFNKLLPYFRRVEFAGGEPLMDPTHFKILQALYPYGNNIEIKYATNGTKFGINKNENIYRYWPNFKSVALNISIDGIEDSSYEYIRGNGDWRLLIENIYKFKEIPNISRIVGAVAVQVSNALDLDKMIRYFLDDIGIVFYANMVRYPQVLSIQVLPAEIKNIVVDKLIAVRQEVSKFKLVKENPILENITYQQIDGIINFIQSDNKTDLWQDCIDYNKKLDKTRKQDFFAVHPEFKKYA